MKKFLKLVVSAVIFSSVGAHSAFARDLDKSDPDRAQILAAVHRLNANDPNLKDNRYVVVDLVKDHDAAFVCVALAEKDGGLELTDDQAEIMTFVLAKRNAQWTAVALNGGGFAQGAKPAQSDCFAGGRIVNTRADIDAALKATGHKPFASH